MITPKKYERQLRDWLREREGEPTDIEVGHLEKIAGSGGEYEFDVVAHFTRFSGVQFTVLVELCAWPEQRDYELIRPLVLFGDPVARRAEETGASEGTLYRRTSAFDLEGMESLFGSETAGRRRLPPAMRRLIVDLKAEHPPMRPHEISTVCYVRFGWRAISSSRSSRRA